MKRLVVIILTLLVFAGVAHADEPQARFSLERGSQPHAGMPFKLILAAGGFDQSPAPEQPKLTIANATVTPLGASPNVSQSISMSSNGHQTVQTSVTWIFSYRVESANPGRLQIPTTTVAQGGKRATAQGATIDLHAVPSTDDMKLELHLPDRAVFVGETIEADLVWLFRSQPEDWTFALAMAQLPELTVSAPPVTDRRRVIEVASATKTLDLPFAMDETEINGRSGAVRRSRCSSRRISPASSRFRRRRSPPRCRPGRAISSATPKPSCFAPAMSPARLRSSRCPRPTSPEALQVRSAPTSRSRWARRARWSSSASRSSSRSP
jgi:hypothetical protein